MPPKPTVYQEVGINAPPKDIPKLNKSASRWRKTDLVKLGVDYRYDHFEEIVIGKGDGDMPPDLL
jgi:hypothetical protein